MSVLHESYYYRSKTNELKFMHTTIELLLESMPEGSTVDQLIKLLHSSSTLGRVISLYCFTAMAMLCKMLPTSNMQCFHPETIHSYIFLEVNQQGMVKLARMTLELQARRLISSLLNLVNSAGAKVC